MGKKTHHDTYNPNRESEEPSSNGFKLIFAYPLFIFASEAEVGGICPLDETLNQTGMELTQMEQFTLLYFGVRIAFHPTQHCGGVRGSRDFVREDISQGSGPTSGRRKQNKKERFH